MVRSSNKKSPRSSRSKISSSEEQILRLETQLFEVIEREGMTISSSTIDDSKLSNRARRGIRRRQVIVAEPKTDTKLVTTSIVNSIPDPIQNPISALDKVLVQHVQALREQAAENLSPTKSLQTFAVPIRFSAHEPSDHILSFEAPARPIIEERRTPFGQTVRHWLAPYQIPPSIDGLAAATQDLWVESIDPRSFLEQFTPAQAHIAYRESYSIWSKISAPFVTWEAVGTKPVQSVVVERSAVDEGDTELLPQESVDVLVDQSNLAFEQEYEEGETALEAPATSIFESEQFTSQEAQAAYQASYGWSARIKRGLGYLASIFERSTQTVEEEARETVEAITDEVHEISQEAEQAWGVPLLVPRLHTLRIMVGFFGLAIFVSLPAGAVSLSRSVRSSVHNVKAQSVAALSDVQVALQDSGDEQANAWSSASARFASARESLMRTNAMALGLAQALPQTRAQYSSAQALLTAGERSAQAAKLLTSGVSRALDDRVGVSPDERIGTFMTYLDYASPLMEEALSSLSQVDASSLPPQVGDQVTQLRGMIGDGHTSLTDARSLLSFLRDALGHDSPRTYLFVFQNHAELRPTGGFMGSVAEVVFDRGAIQSIHVPGGGPYDLRDQLHTRVAAPGPLQLVNGRWEFQDANWFPDFPASAKKINWFWSQAGQPTLDGVVTINASMLQELLKITGPIEMPEYGKTLTAENVMLELQKSVELEYDKTENKPKKIIGDLLPKILERLKSGSKEEWLHLVDMSLHALETKDIQVWMARDQEEQMVEQYNWNGRLKPTIGDSLAIIEANIAGQKTDTSIPEQVDHHVEIAADGSIMDTVTLTRVHQAPKGELFSGVNNVSYVRVYVPQGSTLVEASGFATPSSTLFDAPLPEDLPDPDQTALVQAVSSTIADVDITNEFGRTAFGGWMQLKPGETRTTTFRYKLPFTVFDIAARAGEENLQANASASAAYMVLLTSQSGKANREIKTTVSMPSGWTVKWSNQDTTSTALELSTSWNQDKVLAGLLDTASH